ncbi:MAG TPA: transposase, partial [Myxococcaceae bacterium]|nr:transposase [Myxococcaceae bacterium]
EEALRARPGPALVRLTWLLLRHGRSEELAERLPEWTALFAEVYAAPDGVDKLGRVMRYLLLIGGREAHEAAGQVLHSVVDAQRAEELMRSYGEELIEQGRVQERAALVLRVLDMRSVPVDEEVRQRILTCTDLALLDRWIERALNATRLSDVLDEQAQ